MTRHSDPWLAIPQEEFQERQERARQAAQEAGLDGLVVYSRGGGFMDMCADVLYLTNHYSNQPFVPDHAGVGNARSHGAVILPVDGPTVLINDVPWGRRDLTVADDVRYSIYVTDRVGEALEDSGLKGKRVGMVGASYMTAAAYLGLLSVAGSTELIRRDDLIEKMRMIKSPAEQAIIRRSAEIGNRAVEAIMDAAVEGATEGDAVGAGTAVIAESGAAFYEALCASGPHSHLVAYGRLPSHDITRKLTKGDMFRVDSFGAYGGYYWDFARTRIVGDEPTDFQRDLAEAMIAGVEHICDAIRPGVTGEDLLKVGMTWMEESPVLNSLPQDDDESEGFPAVGHGLGLSWEGPWLMEGDHTVIEPGMYLAVELFAGHESVGGAMFEHNGLVTREGFEILTNCRKRWW